MTRRCWVLLAAVTLFGCNAVLELDKAHVDPTLSASRGGSDSAGSGASEGGAAGAPGAAASLCEQYCEAITTSCTGEDTQYTDSDACMMACPYFPEGVPGDEDVNTLHCRLGHALKARSEPLTYCTWAGPGGDGMCGSNCEGFCTLMGRTCTAGSTTTENDYFDDEQECLSACSKLKVAGRYSATDDGITSGADLLECRLYHVTAAIYADDPAVHCPHAMGLRLCVD